MKAAWIGLGALVLAGVCWLIWGPMDGGGLPARPQPPAAVAPVAIPSAAPAVPVTAAAAAAPAASEAGFAAQPVLAPPAKPPADAWEEVARKVEEAERLKAMKGPPQPFAVYYNNLQNALEAARRAMPASSPVSEPPAAQAAPGAGISPFSKH